MDVIVRAALAYVLVTAFVRLKSRRPGGARGVPAAAATPSEWLVLALSGGIGLTGLWSGRSTLVEVALGAATVVCLHRLHAWLAQRGRRRDAQVRAARWH